MACDDKREISVAPLDEMVVERSDQEKLNGWELTCYCKTLRMRLFFYFSGTADWVLKRFKPSRISKGPFSKLIRVWLHCRYRSK